MMGTCHQQAPSWSSIAASSSRPPHNKNNKICRLLLRSSFFTSAEAMEALTASSSSSSSFQRPFNGSCRSPIVQASFTHSPVLWAVRMCVFYALLQVGIAGHPPPSILEGDGKELQHPKWLQNLLGKNEEAERAKELKKARNKWQTTTKGTLKRRYRVPTKSEGRRLLNMISSLLSDDDTFRDATSHKGCQIRRENAHAETVCCHNVRAMFDELPTPHLVIEITAFPAGPITVADYQKSNKIEKLLRTGNSI